MARSNQSRRPLSEVELAAVAVGEQPEEDGLLACLECGLWYRGLGGHVARAHGIRADEYRARHELPRNRGLWAGRYPKAVKTRLRGTRAEVERAVAAQQESSKRAGTRARKRENWDRMAAQKRQRTQDKYEGLARAAGYAGIDDLIEQVADEPAAVLAEILDLSVSGAKWVRRLHAAGFNLEHHPPVPASMSAQDLSRLERGTQPVTETHVLCRVCGPLPQCPRPTTEPGRSARNAGRRDMAMTTSTTSSPVPMTGRSARWRPCSVSCRRRSTPGVDGCPRKRSIRRTRHCRRPSTSSD